MKRQSLVEAVVFVAMLASGVALRLLFQELPNFAPVAAMALFAGFFFRSAIVAAMVPVAVMSVSDYWIGGYDLPMMLVVYAALVLPVAGRSLMRRAFSTTGSGAALRSTAGLAGGSLSASCLFFLITNFGAFCWYDTYDHSWEGLVSCYVAALPFFRSTLAGDMTFAIALFGGYAWACSAGLVVASPRAAACTAGDA